RARLAAQFEGVDGGGFKLNFHLAPPLLAKVDPQTGLPKKMKFGPWMMTAFSVLAKMKGLRGTAFDIFGRTAERQMERALIGEYEQLVDEILVKLTAENHTVAVQLANLPEEIRGYGHVKDRNLKMVRAKWSELLGRLRGQQTAQVIKMPVKAA